MVKLFTYERVALDPKDDFIRESINVRNACEKYKDFFPPFHLEVCKNWCGLQPDYSIYEGLHRLFTGYYESVTKARNFDRKALKDYYSSSEAATLEMLSFYLVICIRAFTTDFAVSIERDINNRDFTLGILTYTYMAQMVAAFFVYKYYWLKLKKNSWYKLVHTLLVLNDNVLYNEYIKGYFSIQWKRL